MRDGCDMVPNNLDRFCEDLKKCMLVRKIAIGLHALGFLNFFLPDSWKVGKSSLDARARHRGVPSARRPGQPLFIAYYGIEGSRLNKL